jgi:hypothetical protein
MNPFEVDVRGELIKIQPELDIDPTSVTPVIMFYAVLHGKRLRLRTSFNIEPTRASAIDFDDSYLGRQIKVQVADEIMQHMLSRL